MTKRSVGIGVARWLNPLPLPTIGPRRALWFKAGFLGADNYDGGKFKIVGTTKITGAPTTHTRVRVRLHDQLSGRVVREQWSDALTGSYSFLNIRSGAFYVLAFDHTGQYRAVIADSQTPEPM